MKKRNQIKKYGPKKGAIWSGILIGAVGLLCAGAIAVAIGGAINGVGFTEQIVTWAGGIMPPTV